MEGNGGEESWPVEALRDGIFLLRYYFPLKNVLIIVLKVCLFRGKIGWMENFGDKMGRKIFLSMFG